jgi:short-subunit dehydrogenase
MPQSNVLDTATAGWLGFKAGKCMITPNWRNKSALAMSKLLPRSMVLQLVGFLQRTR